VTQSEFVREQLATHHDLNDFNSGELSIDSWLRESALLASTRDYSRTYVWHSGDDRVVAFFTLSAFAITREELPRNRARGEQRGIPALLLGKLALDKSIQGKGLSRVLIADAVTEAVKASQYAAVRYLVVDALNPSLVEMYEKFGFRCAPGSDGDRTRLSARIKDLAASLGI
jgi:GNAT superfamily N-acetyltransferase